MALVVYVFQVKHLTDTFKKRSSGTKDSLEDVNQELEQVDIRNTAIRPTSNITYLNDDLTPPIGHPDSTTGRRNHYAVHP